MAKRKAEDISGQIKEVEQDLVDCTAALKSGTYPELMRINDSLLRAKERREAMADKHRKLQIKNINELYEYELRDIEVRMSYRASAPAASAACLHVRAVLFICA